VRSAGRGLRRGRRREKQIDFPCPDGPHSPSFQWADVIGMPGNGRERRPHLRAGLLC